MEPAHTHSSQKAARLNDWFEVDKEGLAKLLERKGKEFALFELIQNAWDEPGVTKVTASLEYRGWNKALLVVEDDAPEGFRELSHAFTLFAESGKKANPEQRGRFNLGEKLVLAISEEVAIRTTTGGLRFDSSGRHVLRSSVPVGSRIECLLRIKEKECDAIKANVCKLIPPRAIKTVFNGQELPTPVCVGEVRADLQTEIANEDGLLRRPIRSTTIRLFPVRPGEIATLYEMGIPIVETGDKWHCDIAQKVPLTLDRDNVMPSFLSAVRLAVFAQMHSKLGLDDVNAGWVQEAVASSDCTPEGITSYLDKRFGEKRVSFDPSDPEANKLAVSHGYTVVHGSMMSGEIWKNAKEIDAILPAGKVTPGPKVWTGEGDPNARIFDEWIPESKWTNGMREIARFAESMARHVIEREICVRFCASPHHLGAASYGPTGNLVFNKFRLGADWFEQGINSGVVELLIHEFGHNSTPDHLSSDYHQALCRIGAKLFALAQRGDFPAAVEIWIDRDRD